MVDWLYHHVEGFPERREARKYASGLLKAGLIRHTVNKITFSEQCYYVFGDLSGGCESCECPCPSPGRADLAASSCLSNPRPKGHRGRQAACVLRWALCWLVTRVGADVPLCSARGAVRHVQGCVCWWGGRLFLSHIEARGTSGGPGRVPALMAVAGGTFPVRGLRFNPHRGWLWGNGSQFLFIRCLGVLAS